MQNKWAYGASGYLVVGISCTESERFFNMCRAHGIELWEIRQNTDNCYSFRVYAAEFARIRPLAKKTKAKVKVLAKKGLPFKIPILRKYSPLILAVLLLTCALICSTNYIWAVEYVGNLQISDDELDDFIKGENIRYGISKKDIDCDSIEKDIRKSFDQVIWTSVYFEGTKLFVSIKENEKTDPKSDSDIPSDIVADMDGEIVSMLVRNGQPLVAVGDSVEKGDILVSRNVPIYNEELEVTGYQSYKADADIYIRTQYECSLGIDNAYSIINYTGNNIKSYYLEAFGYSISNIAANKFLREKRNMSYVTITKRRQVCLGGNFYLPIYFGEINRKEYYVQYRTYTEEQMHTKLTEDLQKIISGLEEKGIKIVEKNVKMVQNRDSMELQGYLVIIAPVQVD